MILRHLLALGLLRRGIGVIGVHVVGVFSG